MAKCCVFYKHILLRQIYTAERPGEIRAFLPYIVQCTRRLCKWKRGKSYDPETKLGPVVSKAHQQRVCEWIQKGIDEGARLVLDGRDVKVDEPYQNGYYARKFEFLTDGGMVGINVGIPVPTAYFPFSGNKDSFFGDLHVLGKDGVRFYTRAKTVTKHWYDEASRAKTVDTWEGTVER